MSEKYDGKGKFNWTFETAPKGNVPQCADCRNNVYLEITKRVECEVFGYPRPVEYVRNEIVPCPQFKKIK
jgi:hypothetical protein